MLENILDFDAFLFDLDGTLIDTEPLHMAAWKQTVQNYGFTLNWSLKQYLSNALVSRPHLFEAIYQACPGLKELFPNGELLRQEKIRMYENLLLKTPPNWTLGALEFLSWLKAHNKEMVIVTNSPRKHVDTYKHLPFDNFFKKILTIDDFVHPKPDPAGYLSALTFLQKKGRDCLVFEDSLKGILSAKNAGVKSLLIATEDYKKSASIPQTEPFSPSFQDILSKISKKTGSSA
jgi:HAD superfamily hydrolase (TIGR01509 family)